MLINFLLTIIADWIIYLYISNKLSYYVHPRYAEITLATAIILFAVGLINLLTKNYSRGVTSSGIQYLKDSFRNNFNLQNILFVMFLITLLLPNYTLSSNIAEIRDTNSAEYSSSNILEGENYSKFLQVSTIDMSYGELYQNLKSNLPDKFVGSKVKLSGIYGRTSDENYFRISRFAITCCAIDARPLSFYFTTEISKLSEFKEYMSQFVEDQWLEIEGELQIANLDGNESLVVIVHKASRIETPENPYIY